MALSTSSIIRLAYGDINHLPTQLQILNIHRLNGDLFGTFIARLKLSDGINYYGGFVIDVSVLESVCVDIYAIVCLKKIVLLNDSPGKQVLQIIEMELVSLENAPIGDPKPCPFPSTTAVASTMVSILSQEPIASLTSHPPVCEEEQIPQTPVLQENPTSIVNLSTQLAWRATVEGRIIRKSDMFTYSNGAGKFFTFDLADLTAEIRCKAFNDVADMFFEQIVIGNVYRLSHFGMNLANKRYNHLPLEFEINMTNDSVILPIHDDRYKNVDVAFNFTKISNVSSNDVGKCIDLLVSIKSIGDVDSVFVLKKNSFLNKRVVIISDGDDCTEVLLWGDLAKKFAGKVNQTMALKDLLVQSFKGQLKFASTMLTIVRFQE